MITALRTPFKARLHRLGLACLCLVAQGVAKADSWPAPVITEVFSASREWFVRVVPGRSLGDTVGFAGSPKGPYAKAEWYRRDRNRSYHLEREMTLANPVAPVKFLVTDRGYLVTLDNWHNMGYGTVVGSYAPDGRQVAAHRLETLFTPEEIAAFRTSVSSIWWRTDTVYVREGQRSVYVAVGEKGAELIVEPETGAWQYCESRGGKHLCRTMNDNREWRPYREPGTQVP
ncbi:MAG TPA: hypothetical protein VLD67_22425 [Vicinamibacterales bacterium]|nr:hypothetical protein [Vicinamibacterales bacterium]